MGWWLVCEVVAAHTSWVRCFPRGWVIVVQERRPGTYRGLSHEVHADIGAFVSGSKAVGSFTD